jgi:CDP-2,3-bis-(O-geranylgeranyl)-sn-glycerol synthase
MGPLETVVAGIWLMLPALIPNSAAVLLGGGTPMDFGSSWRGKRILGDGKTWRGFFGGALAGALFGMIIAGVALAFESEGDWGYGDWSTAAATVLSLSFGSMAGDAVGSFVKRRIGKGRGEKAIVLDQYNFVAGAFVLVLLVNPGWFVEHYFEGSGIVALIVFLIAVPLIHRGVNIIGYKMGKKDVPW